MQGNLAWELLWALLAGIAAFANGASDVIKLWKENPEVKSLLKQRRFWIAIVPLSIGVAGVWAYPLLRAPLPAVLSVEKFSSVSAGHDPTEVIEIPPDKLRDGYVLVGGGCEVSYASNQSRNAELLFDSSPVTNGWSCRATDPALFFQPGEPSYPPPSVNEKRVDDGKRIWNPARIKATVIFAKVVSRDKSLRLVSIVKENSSEATSNPEAEAALDDASYVLTAGGCKTAPLRKASIPELIVVSKPNADGDGWHCKGIDPSDVPNDSRISAYVVGAKLMESGLTWLRHTVSLHSEVTVGPLDKEQYPLSVAVTDNKQSVTGGGCEVSYFSSGSQWPEYMVVSTASGKSQWTCKGGDPPYIPNAATARAYAVTLEVK